MPKHTWIEKDDLMILFVYRFGIENSPLNKQQIADRIGTSLGSVNYRLGNFKAIEGEGGFTHFAKLSLKVHKKYSDFTMTQLKTIAFDS